MTIKGRYEEDARNKLWPADLLLAVKRGEKKHVCGFGTFFFV